MNFFFEQKITMKKSRIPVVFFCICSVLGSISRSEDPAPGKQVSRSAILPASTLYRKPATEQERSAEKARRDGLSQEERKAEDKERRARMMERMLKLEPLKENETQTISYWIFLPEDYETKSGKRWPLLLFLHGSGERGAEIEKVKVHGPPKILGNTEKAKDWPFITISPQCPENYTWSPNQLALLLDEIEKNFNVDRNRIYATGLSMGGFGTWSLLYHYPKRFTAGVPICGGFNPDAAESFVDMPLWVFHGAKDQAVRVESSTNVVDAIKEKGGEKVRLTIYPDLEHDSWTVTYDNPELYVWLLEQRKTDVKSSDTVPSRRERTDRRPFRNIRNRIRDLR